MNDNDNDTAQQQQQQQDYTYYSDYYDYRTDDSNTDCVTINSPTTYPLG
eukprot:CAMPEP_0170965142 /NCGR_PEP_ID=MMETSP0735-20130129/40772_1 /TAXON_ID=186038 /ORGANISM="Fragilariopsis kerguelensis, Strain L26-C5" /LENGTH=48 /DNA_ID= /DNA_START= /DNA_END= /DNA_ORIENTATION=